MQLALLLFGDAAALFFLPARPSEVTLLLATLRFANLVDILATTPKANAGGLISGLNERQEELNALEARIRATKTAPEALGLEIRRYEAELGRGSISFASCSIATEEARAIVGASSTGS